MECVYPAIFHTNKNGSYTITYPDLPGCISEGRDLSNAIFMAQSALTQWVEFLSDKKEPLPNPSPAKGVVAGESEFVNLIRADIKDGRAVKRTISIPKWMDDKVSEAGLSLSRVLQDALAQKFS